MQAFEERRKHYQNPESLEKQQLMMWTYDSHMWEKVEYPGGWHYKCKWCDWTPPTEVPLDMLVRLCPQNPKIREAIKNHDDQVHLHRHGDDGAV